MEHPIISQRRKRKEQEKVARAHEELRSRALKAVKLSGMYTGAQMIHALETYIQRLRELQDDLSQDYLPGESRSARRWVQFEISRAIEELARERISQINPL